MTRIKQTKQQYVYEYIRNRILSNELTPGTILTEESICKTLNVSRTPVREAIRRLTGENLLIVTPGVGLSVPSVRLEDLMEIYDIRETLESLAIRLFIRRAAPDIIDKLSETIKKQETAFTAGNIRKFMDLDMVFHRQIDTVAGNNRLSAMLDSIYEQINRLAYLDQDDSNILEIAIPAHKKIMKYIIVKDSDNAVLAMQEHIRTLKKYYLTKYFDI